MRHTAWKTLAGIIFVVMLSVALISAAATVPAVIEQPGSQPGDANLETPDKCDNCHGGYNAATEPAFNWRGSMMANALRDPIFWAAVSVAEQDFIPNTTVWNNLMPGTTPDTGGVGDLCLRCHTPDGWLARRSTPTDGSGLAASDFNSGVSCDLCHRLVDPASSEGMSMVKSDRQPFWTNPDTGLVEGFYGSGQYVVDSGSAKRGPFDDATARHQFIPSTYHRSGDLCGTCHDVSNPAAGDLAPNSGRLDETQLGSRVAFHYPPYAYGIVERTYSEWKSSAWDTQLVRNFTGLPANLQTIGGAPEWASHFPEYNSSSSSLYNPPRSYSCQTCHMPPVTGQGCNKNPEIRTDLPLHDQTGGNTWIPEAMIWLSGQGKLKGGALTQLQIDAMRDGVRRARLDLRRAASIEAVTAGDGASLLVRVTNLTGHKFLSGYPEGRRAWVNVRFDDQNGLLLAELGRYDTSTADLAHDSRVYEVRPGMTRDWAQTLVSVGYDRTMPLTFHADGSVEHTLGAFVDGTLGETLETFHFVLNNKILADHRIPPYGMSAQEAAKRNVLPVPADAYPVMTDGTYRYWDDITVPVPPGTARADVTLFYQSTSKEYIAFLRHANTTTTTGEDLYQAWLNTGMSPPEMMATASWTAPPCPGPPAPVADLMVSAGAGVDLSWTEVSGATGYRVYRYLTPNRSDSPVMIPTSLPSAADAALRDGVNYFYDVRAINACGESAP